MTAGPDPGTPEDDWSWPDWAAQWAVLPVEDPAGPGHVPDWARDPVQDMDHLTRTAPRAAPRTVRTAMEWMWSQHTSGSTAWRNLCLSLCRQAWGLPAVHPSAIDAAHAVDPADRIPWQQAPPGAPVFFAGGEFGHIVLAVGDGTCLTNDATGVGKVGRVPLDWFVRNWGQQPLWAARTLNGHRLPLPLPPSSRREEIEMILVKATGSKGQWTWDGSTLAAVTDPDSSKNLQAALGPVVEVSADQIATWKQGTVLKSAAA